MTEETPPQRQFVAVKFRTEDTRAYTYHNDGEPVGAGQQVKLPARGKNADPDEWVRGTVVEINVPAPTGFATKAILGLAPIKGEERTDVDALDDADLDKGFGDRS